MPEGSRKWLALAWKIPVAIALPLLVACAVKAIDSTALSAMTVILGLVMGVVVLAGSEALREFSKYQGVLFTLIGAMTALVAMAPTREELDARSPDQAAPAPAAAASATVAAAAAPSAPAPPIVVAPLLPAGLIEAESARTERAEAALLRSDWAGASTLADGATEALLPYDRAIAAAELLTRARTAGAHAKYALAGKAKIADLAAHASGPPAADIVAYRDRLLADRAELANLSPALRSAFAKDVAAAAKGVERALKRIKRDVDKEEKARLHAAAMRLVCGEKPPLVGGWDEELVGAERYIAKTANDPDSIDVENCTQPVLTEQYCWVVKCQVRGKNAFGALVLNRMTFSVGREGILGVE